MPPRSFALVQNDDAQAAFGRGQHSSGNPVSAPFRPPIQRLAQELGILVALCFHAGAQGRDFRRRPPAAYASHQDVVRVLDKNPYAPDKIRRSAAPKCWSTWPGCGRGWSSRTAVLATSSHGWTPSKWKTCGFSRASRKTPEKAARSFAAVPEHHLFIGHLHRWLAVTPQRRIEWAGETPLDLATEPRSLVVIAPVVACWSRRLRHDGEAANADPVRGFQMHLGTPFIS